ncbi:protein angel homolog 2-like [Sphaerodactylus townsendi]|uniref:protein angel homolog 2-like n=1 Tax=Sphaerodactylus townsendi TaxID=933632 RepID=UPI002026180E|nr:protein angel homolog 2-like [Sphaerodactylus townsendi]
MVAVNIESLPEMHAFLGGCFLFKVSGQEQSPTGKRILSIPIWPQSLGISQDCMYEEQQKQLAKERERGEAKENTLEASEEIVIVSQRLPTDLHHSFQLSSAYSHYLPDSDVPVVTTCHSKGAVTVDYIFYSEARDNMADQSEKGRKRMVMSIAKKEKGPFHGEYGKMLTGDREKAELHHIFFASIFCQKENSNQPKEMKQKMQ